MLHRLVEPKNYVFLTQWNDHSNAVARYDRWNADKMVWAHDGQRYGLWWRGRDSGDYVSARLYDRQNYWAFVIRATSAAERDVALDKIGAARPPQYIQGRPN